ncbi:UNVERIFIED_ORG: branched-chain amino acid transport system ATP-binding protein [Nocardia globerula]|uniref:Branched-chain amino acid transport system ATP-binding protein n=1 Tax=Nocardia globerula TaxID=1818 RepID=A0A652YW69_NOCGL|nr:ATP-binding cassette domain-containing protein [Rhodococcus globerulus]NMD59671.1 ABC transporter ATP-binding protein [Nocardia globerula]PVX64248.1 branched-chain amino acid transport system ATP-binding protein [Rhodococcus globerulus]
MTDPLLEVRGLHKSYGGVRAVDDVSFSVGRGEVIGLVGPNGAGKTTLVDCIFGTQQADSGTVTLAGKSLTGPSERRARQGLSRTFQHPQLALELNAVDNIIPGLYGHRITSPLRSLWWAIKGPFENWDKASDQASALAREYSISDTESACGDLSLGAQRLVEVARAMATGPEVLLLDEPFAGADHDGIDAVSGAVRSIAAQGKGVVLVDHNVDLIAELATTVVLLNFGGVAFYGPPQDCLSSDAMREVYFGSDDEEGVSNARGR